MTERGAGAPDAKQQRQIPTEKGRLVDTADRMGNAIETLEVQLNPILSPAVPPEKSLEDEEALVLLAEEIRTVSYRLLSYCIAVERLSEGREV